MEAFLGQCRWKPFKHRRRWTKLVPMPFFFKKISLLQYFTNFWSCSLVSIYNLPGVPIGLAQVKVRHRKNCDCCLWKKWQGPRQWQQQRQWQRKCWRLVTFETLVTIGLGPDHFQFLRCFWSRYVSSSFWSDVSKVRSQSEWVTRSSIELFWDKNKIPVFTKLWRLVSSK